MACCEKYCGLLAYYMRIWGLSCAPWSVSTCFWGVAS